jgi:hypothetical protein
MDYIALKAELDADPLGRGYAGMTDEQATDDLNTVYRDVNYPVLIDSINQAIRDNGKWTQFREAAELQQTPGMYNNQSMREFMDIFTTFTSLPNVDLKAPYLDGLLADMVTEGSMGQGAATAISNFGIQSVSRGTELELGNVRTGDVEHARTL